MRNFLKKQKSFSLAFLLVFLIACNYCVFADGRVVIITDGLSHEINNDVYKDKIVKLDYEVDNSPGTHIDVLDGAVLDTLYAWSNSSFTMSSGSAMNLAGFQDSTISLEGGVAEFMGAYGNSIMKMSGGSAKHITVNGTSFFSMTGGSTGYTGLDFRATEYSNVNISGGIFGGRITVLNDSIATVSGGSMPALRTRHNGIIRLEGTGFEVDGVPLENGDRLSDFGTLVELRSNGDIRDYYKGQISGYLADGSALDIPYYIFNKGFYEGTGDIIIVPEPTSLLLLGLGGIMLRRKIR